MRRMTRLTNAFSKKVDNLAAAVALHFMHYNFARPHQSLGRNRTPAMAAGISDHVWTCEEIAGTARPLGSKVGDVRGLAMPTVVSWVVAILVAMALFGASYSRPADVLVGSFMLGPYIMVVTAPSVALSVFALRRKAWQSHIVTFATASGAYLAGWTVTVILLTWIPPLGSPTRSLDVVSAFWYGPVVALTFGALMAITTRSAANHSN
jgi:Na+/H+-translocating membrane pyrophosphatase